MTFYPEAQTAPPLRKPEPGKLDQTTRAIAEWLADVLMLDQGRPRRVARMSKPGERKADGSLRGKYEDIPGQLTPAMLCKHAAGAVTYSCTLDRNGRANAGVIEIDEGGRAALLATLAAAQRRGRVAFAFEQIGEHHTGGHVWVLYDQAAPLADIRAEMQQICADAGLPADTELWPQNQGIRSPFGVHQVNRTRGSLLLQSGEIIALDSELAAGFAAVRALPLNSAPAPAPVVEKPAQQPRPANVISLASSAKPRQRASAGRIDTAAIGTAVRARFNAEHTWSDLLSGAGGTEVRNGWQCNCGWKHAGGLQIAVTSQDKIVSYSPNCSWAPHKDSGRALDKFGFAVAQTYHGSYSAAVEALARQYGLWVETTRQKRQEPLPAEPARRRTQTPAQLADAQRKRQQRLDARAARVARIDELCGQLDQDARIYDFARDVFAYHLSCWAENPEHFASVERIARAVLTLDRTPTESEYRRVQLAHTRLIEAGYLLRTIRTDPGRKNTNCWQPGLADGDRVIRAGENVAAHQDAENDARITLIESSTDLYSNTRSCEARAQAPEPPALGEPDTLDTWQFSPDEHGADELAFLDAPPAADPEIAPEPEPGYTADEYEHADGWRVYRLYSPQDEPIGWFESEHKLHLAVQLLELGASLPTVLAIHALDCPPMVEPPGPPAAHQAALVEPDPAGLGACYIPPAAEPSGAYSGKPKHYADFATRWAWSNDAIARKEAPEAPPAGPVKVIDLYDPRWAAQEEPQVRCAPLDPERRARYFAMRNKAKRASSTAQRRWLDKQADEMMIWLPQSEAQALRERAPAPQDAPPSQARGPQARPAPAHQAPLFAGAL